jgi:integrase
VDAVRETGFHQLRHHFASACLANGVDIRSLAANLGHTDPGFTLRTYTHLMPDADDRLRLAIDRVFTRPDGPATAREAGR